MNASDFLKAYLENTHREFDFPSIACSICPLSVECRDDARKRYIKGEETEKCAEYLLRTLEF